MGRFPTCSICIDSLGDFSDVGACSCGHAFHHQCLVEWMEKSSRPACPTCMARFGNEPPSALVTKLYFSFDADFKATEFNDEYLAKQMDLNEKLQAKVGECQSQMEQLKTRLTKLEADLKRAREDKELAKKALEANEGKLKTAMESKERLTAWWRLAEDDRAKAEEEKAKAKEDKAMAEKEKKQAVAAKIQAIAAKILADEAKIKAEEALKKEKEKHEKDWKDLGDLRDIVIRYQSEMKEGAKSKAAESGGVQDHRRHIFIKNLDGRVKRGDIKVVRW